MIFPLVILFAGLAGVVYSARSFKRQCQTAAETYDPIRATAPRGLTSSTGCGTLRGMR